MYSVEKKALLYSLIQLWSWKTNMSINYRHIYGGGVLTLYIQTIYTFYKPKLTKEQHLLQLS